MSILCKAAAVKTKKEFREVSYLLNSTLHGLSVQSQKSILAHIKVHKVKTYVGEQMKSFLIRDKQFLLELYEGENLLKKKRLLTFANDAHLNTLLKFLHYF